MKPWKEMTPAEQAICRVSELNRLAFALCRAGYKAGLHNLKPGLPKPPLPGRMTRREKSAGLRNLK